MREEVYIVYAIQHNITKRIYVGQSKNFNERVKAHFGTLRLGKHNPEMQHDFDKYGDDYSVFILEELDCYGMAKAKEGSWMEKLKTYDKRFGYNYRDPRFSKRKREEFVVTPGIPEVRTEPFDDGLTEEEA